MPVVKRLLFLPLLFLCGHQALAATPLSGGTLRELVIYPDRAQVSRAFPISLRAGENVIELSGVSASLVDASVQASLDASDRARIVDLEVRRSFVAVEEREPLRQLRARLDQLGQELAAAQNALAVEQNSVTFLQQLKPFPPEQPVPFAAVRDYLTALEPALAARLARVAEWQQTISGLLLRRQELEKELRNLGSGSDHVKQIRITLAAQAAVQTELVCTYQLTDVTWTPRYEVRADSRTRQVELSLFALVRQNSGEEFAGKGVVLSTARPQQHGPLPEFQPWWLDVYQPPQPRARMALAEPMLESAGAMDKMLAEEDHALSAPAPPEVRSEATSLSYVLAQAVVVPADNQPHKLLVSTTASDARFEYLAAPRLSPYAHLTASLDNPFVFPIAGGELRIFLDGRFVRSDQVGRPVLAGDELRLELGVDETLDIRQNLVRRFTEPPGVFSSRTREEYGYVTELVNGKPVPVTLELRDQIPVAVHEEIRVQLLEPAAAEVQVGDDGVFRRSVTLAPGERRQLPTRFEVSYPARLRITGL